MLCDPLEALATEELFRTMLCPIDQTELVISVRQEVEIDYCPTCRGVWLDRGELDKIIDRAAALSSPAVSPAAVSTGSRETAFERETDRSYRRDDDDDDDDDRNNRNQGFGRKKKKRESFLSDLFDF
jgi:Zn-finger nucleic acid-binding protein